MPETIDLKPFLKECESLWRGLRPLPVHVNMALAEYMNNPAVAREMSARVPAMIEGIKSYMAHPYRRSIPPLDKVWQKGEVSLCYAGPEDAESATTLFLVPSLINRSHILDLVPEKSFTRWMARHGFHVYLLDWGVPADDPGLETLDSLIAHRLLPAMQFTGEKHGGFHALGYCMGGTLLAAAAASGRAALPELRSLVFLAAPWDFHAGDRMLADHVRAGAPVALQMIESSGRLPANWIQSVFAAVSRDKTIKKFSDFAALPPDSDKARLFVAVEDWLNEGVDLPGKIATTCILNWYGENGLCRDKGEKSRTPAFILAAARDRLVPEQSALALAGRLPEPHITRPETGHIGMMVGSRAETEVWRPVLRWLQGGYMEDPR